MHSAWPTTRRSLLRTGVVLPAAIWLAGCSPRRGSSPTARAQRIALPPEGEEILRVVIPAVLGPLYAGGPAYEETLDAGIGALDEYLAHLSPALQEEARGAFAMLDLLPARVVLLGHWGPWRDAPVEAVEKFLRSARESRLAALRRVYAFLQSMAVVAWFDQPMAWQAAGYPGPPVGEGAGN